MTAITFTARDVKDAASAKTQCAILPLFEGEKLLGPALEIDRGASGAITAALALGDFRAKRGQSLMLPGSGGAKRILLIGCGEGDSFDRAAARRFCQTICGALRDKAASDAMLHLAGLHLRKKDIRWALNYLATHCTRSAYRYGKTLSRPPAPWKLKRLIVNTAGSLGANAAATAMNQGRAVGAGINDARELANLPGNVCTPTYLAKHARSMGRGNTRLTVSVLEEKKMRELGMGSLLSVSAGSEQPAKLIAMQYKGAKASEKPYVLVGKGITFDSGGISLKPGAKMDEMKFDMGGAASVFGTMRALVELELPINVVGLIAAAENMPSSRATKPGDVVTSMSGKTIEILNTDAEGRLVLCDALTFAARYKPAAVIDIATLTGACVVALGSHASALFANDETLAEQLLDAGTEAHDRAWRMPLWDEYQGQLKSNFADIANIGGPGGGSITAACFLSRFAEHYKWAHLDIAGSAWNSAPKGATGRPVALLIQYLMDRASKQG
ncbi:leucyl aminopeptidase [Candidatus Marimicrobium litorale]|uniref:Probable cytosol aminopeptidase n=1 Tax=Candidatus Marimicrobium litorale TaxID=2518991 RepID=A0ABT3T3L9_9GAMM|nr:leucyl aminopeptidase [Candidatus Marimicrobium litorale]MCX2976669.1 leucyl aminopeptidase [Candidatus Marimicrobium litorale]